MSESAHAKIGIGKIYCITNTNRLRATRTIGKTQPPCVKPDCWRYPRRNGRGEVVGDVLISVHAQCVNNPQTNERADNVQRAIGKMQSSCIVPERQQSPWSKHQGGVVGCGAGFAHGLGDDCSHTRCGDSVVISKIVYWRVCMSIACQCFICLAW